MAAPDRAEPPRVRFLNVISTKRSGHHALVNWIEDGSSERTRFINNAVIDEALLRSFAGLVSGARGPLTVIMNFEGVTVSGVSRTIAGQKAAGAAVENILFVRDPLNVCASLMHRKAMVHAELVMVLRQLFSLRDWLAAYRRGTADADLVFYNRWLVDDDYRALLAERLSIAPAAVRNEITKFGGGSSFKDLARGGSEAAPRLTSRWKKYAGDRLFRCLLTHPQFADVFLEEVRGEICDARGESDADAERAAYLEAAVRERRSSPYVDRLIDGLARDPDAFCRIEGLSAGLSKRLYIVRTHAKALFR
jgi:hypothetical protein